MCTRAILLGLVVSLIYVPESAARRRGRGSPSGVALFVTTKGKPNAKLHSALMGEVIRASGDTRVVYGKQLRKAIRRKPDAAVGKCGANLKCIAKLGKQANVLHVIVGRVAAAGKTVEAQFLVVEVASQQAVGERISFKADSADTIKAEIAAASSTLYPSAMDFGGDELPLEMVLGGDEGEETTVASADEPALDEIPLDFGLDTEEELPLADPVDGTTVALSPTEPVEEETTEIAAIDVTTTPTVTDPVGESGSGGVGVLTYTGIGVAALGAGALGVGGYFGLESRSIYEVETGVTEQTKGPKKQEDGDAAVDRANLLFAIGGGLVAVGAILVTLDLVLPGSEPAIVPSVTVGENTAAATLTWSW